MAGPPLTEAGRETVRQEAKRRLALPLKYSPMSETKMLKGYGKAQATLRRAEEKAEFLNKTDEQLFKDAYRAAKQSLPGQSPDIIKQQAKLEFRKLKNQQVVDRRKYEKDVRVAEATKQATEEAMQHGAATLPGSAYPEPEVWGRMLKGQKYQPTEKMVKEELRRQGIVRPTPEQIRAASGERVGPPPKTDESILGTLGRGLEKVTRVPQAFVAGGLAEAAEATKEEPIGAPPPDRPPMSPVEFIKSGHAMKKDIDRPELEGPVSHTVRYAGIPIGEALDKFFEPGISAEEERVQKERAAIGMAPEPPKNLRRDMWDRAWQHAKAVYETKNPQAIEDLVTFYQDARDRYKREALRRAVAQVGPEVFRTVGKDIAKDMIRKTAGEIFEELVRQDMAKTEMDHPFITTLAASFVYDPLWLVSPAKAAKAGVKGLQAAERVPGIGKGAGLLLKGGRAAHAGLMKATEPVRFMGHLWELEAHGPEGKKLASFMRLAHAQGGWPAQLHESLAEGFVNLGKKLPHRSRKLLWEWAEGRMTVGQVLEHPNLGIGDEKKMLDAMESYKAYKEAHEALRSISGVGAGWAEKGPMKGQLLPPEQLQRQYWAPHVKPTKEGKLVQEQIERARDITTGEAGRQRMMARSSKHRGELAEQMRREGKPMWVEDLPTQVAAEAKSPFGRQATQANELNKIRRALGEVNLSKTSSPRKGYVELSAFSDEKMADLESRVPRIVASLEKQTGLKWKRLDSTVTEVWQRITGKYYSTKKGQQVILMPEAVAKRVMEMTPIIVNEGVDPRRWMNWANTALDYSLRPVNKFARTVATVPNLMFAPRNAAGALTLGYLAYGPKVFDPRMQKLAVMLSLGTSMRLPDKMLNSMVTLPASGKKVKLSTLINAAREDGVAGQLQARLSEGMIDPNKLPALPGKLLDWIFERTTVGGIPIGKGAGDMGLSARKWAEISEAYQHILGWLPGLEDLDLLSRAKSYDHMAKYFGDYRRLSTAEKMIMNEMFFFYGWTKFIAGRTIRQAAEDPKKLADFQKLRAHFERMWGAQAPVPPESLRGTQGTLGFTAPPGAQPPRHRKTVEQVLKEFNNGKAELPDENSDAFAIMMMEEPMTMGLYWLQYLEGTWKGSVKPDDNFYDAVTPAAAAGMAMLTGATARGFGMRGPAPEFLTEASYGLVKRPTEAWTNLVQLFMQSGMLPEAIEMQMRMKAYSDWGPAFSVAEEVGTQLGALGWMEPGLEGETVGLPPGWPMTRTQLVEPTRRKEAKKKEAIERIPERRFQLMQTYPRER